MAGHVTMTDPVTAPFPGASQYPKLTSLGELLPFWLGRNDLAPAVAYVDGESWTRSDLSARVAVAQVKLLQWGVEPGTHLALACDNSPEMLVALVAGVSLGAVVIPVNTGLFDDGLRAVLGHCDPDVVVAGTTYLLRCRAQTDSTVPVHLATDLLEGRAHHDPDLIVVSRAPDDPALIIYSSGTTGSGKGVVLSQRACLTASAACAAVQFEATSEDRLYTCLPLFHCAAQQMGLWTTLISGAQLVLDSKFRPARFWEVLARHDVTEFHFIGPMLSALWNQDRDVAVPSNNIRVAGGGGPRIVWEEFEEKYDLDLVECYGMTETFGGCVGHRPGRARPWTLGHAMEHVEVRVEPDSESEAPDGQGEIQIRPLEPHVMFSEYYKDPARTDAAWTDGWYKTGDLGSWTDDGYLVYASRVDDVIRHRGENISSLELEKGLSDLPGIAECAIVGVTGDLGDQEILIAVVLEAGFSFDADKFWVSCAGAVPKFALPNLVLLLDELPRTATHRLQRHVIRGMADQALRRPRVSDISPP
jgi:crotonobetaine/carnitine-CoA ligase